MNTPLKASSSSTQRSGDVHPLPPMVSTTASSHPRIESNKQKRMKRCHGNKKIQRFRRKCRAKGMKPATIAKQVQKRFNVLAKTTTQITTSTNPISNKRKRDPTTTRVVRSSSGMSMVQSPPKKIAKRESQLPRTSMATSENIYRRSTYVKRLSPVLLQALRLKLDHALKKRNEQSFVYERLQLCDQRYCLELHQSLWQSCLTMSSEQQIWPDQLHALANTDDSHLCLQFIEKFISDIRYQLGQCDRALVTQASSYPSSLSADILDQRLKEYAHSQQKTFRYKMNAQLSAFKQNIEEKQLYRVLFSGNLVQVQKNAIRRIMSIQDSQLEQWKELLMLEQRILSKFLPENFDRLQTFVCVDCYTPSINNDCAVRYLVKKLKILQESKRSWLDIHLRAYILKIDEQDRYYQSELVQLEQSMVASINHGETSLFQSLQLYMTQRCHRLKEAAYLQMNFFRARLTRRRQLSSKSKHMVGVSSEVMLDVDPRQHTLNALECEYLSRGGNYIRPNRTILRPYSERKKLVQDEHNKIMKQIVEHLPTQCRSLPATSPLFKQFSQRLHACLTHRYMTPLPYADQRRAKQERDVVKSIRCKLKKEKLVLRQSDKSGNLFIGQKGSFEQKATAYRLSTGAYEELSSNPLEEILSRVTRLLNDLHMKTKNLSAKQYKKMIRTRKDVRLAHMYFNPKTHKDPVTLRPIMNTIRAATTGISHFLDVLIRPLFDRHATPKPIVDGHHLLRQLDQYTRDGYLRPTTLFCTFDITNLYTMLPQNESLDILEEFLRHYDLEKSLGGIPIPVIRQLAEIVLKESAFVYEKKYYRQIVGGAMGSPFTLTLANIFMWKWENSIIFDHLGPNEIYGRYIDDIFFTSNEAKATIEAMLQRAHHFHPNIKLEANIGHSVSFLDLLVSNDRGVLSSSIFHKPSAEPCVVPFASDHPRHVFVNVVQAALLRAVRYSSTLDIFHQEYRHIRLMLLYNGYPSKYLDTHFHKFFTQHLPTKSLLPIMTNTNQFFLIRDKLFAQPSVKEIQMSRRIANLEIKYDNKREKFEKTLFIHYTHESRLEPLKRDIHKIYSDVFRGTEASNIRLIIGHLNSSNIASELIQTRPYPALVKLKPLPSTTLRS